MTTTPEEVPDYTDPQPRWRTGENSRAAIWLRAHGLKIDHAAVVDEEPF
jgi:hypothetical protein